MVENKQCKQAMVIKRLLFRSWQLPNTVNSFFFTLEILQNSYFTGLITLHDVEVHFIFIKLCNKKTTENNRTCSPVVCMVVPLAESKHMLKSGRTQCATAHFPACCV